MVCQPRATQLPRQQWRGLSERSIQQGAGGNAQGLSELFDHRHSRIPRATLDIADISPVDPGLVGISLLAPALRFAKTANILPQARSYIHAEFKTLVSTIDLQTISDNRFRYAGDLRTQAAARNEDTKYGRDRMCFIGSRAPKKP